MAAGLLLCMPAEAAKISDGWGGYKIGMTPAQVRAVPGRSWGAFKGGGPVGLMQADKPVTQYGVAYDFSLWFRPASALDQIFLDSSTTTTSQACEQVFVAALKHGESDYGAFDPVRNAQPPTESGGVSLTVALHDLPGGHSRYQAGHMVDHGMPSYDFQARRTENGDRFTIMSDWTVKDKGQTQGECFTKLIYEKAK